MSDAPSPQHHTYEAIVIGAGMCGVYQLYRLADLGLDVLLLEAGDDVGGTWYWNRYPGARFDSESYSYGYSFSDELLQEWNWSERFAGQPEIHRYISHVVDRFDLRRHMRFESRVASADWHEADRVWTVTLVTGETFRTRLLITAIGVLSIPTPPAVDGLEGFRGPCFHTTEWPADLDLADKRVAVVGTGSTGVQIISEIADEVGELYVFQRHPSWGAPLHNAPISPAEMADIKARYPQIFELCRTTPGGFIHAPDRRRIRQVAEQERLAFWEKLYGEPGFGISLGNFLDCALDEDANRLLSDFIADKIRQRVHDPVVAEKLIPTDHGFGTRRLVMETGYYEVYNRDNVHLVDLLETPLVGATGTGLVTAAGEYEVDVVVLATGFDAVTGSFDHIAFRGVDGQLLSEKWADGPVTYLGVGVRGFPNLLLLAGPQAGSGAANFPRGIEDAVGWVTEFVDHLRSAAVTRVEATAEAEEYWLGHVAERLGKVLVGKTRSWFTGFNSNIPGRDKPRLLLYMGGNVLYRQIIGDVAAKGYEGFVLARDHPAGAVQRGGRGEATVPSGPR